MRALRLAATATLSLTAAALSGTALAQRTLADYAREGKRDVVLAAITSPDVDVDGGTGPLMVATLSLDHEAIELLLAHGAEVDLPNVFQITPLMAAAGMSGTVRAGGGPSGEGEEFEAAVIRTIDLLLDAGASINAQVVDSHTNTAMQDSYIPGADNEGKTALHAAAERGWARVVKHLLERGADPTIEDAYGNTALDLATRGGRAGGRASGAAPRRDEEASAGPTAADVLREAMQGVPAAD